MKRKISLCLFIIMLIVNVQKAKSEGYKPETPEEAVFYAIANKNISPGDITKDNLWQYKEEELCWIGKIIGYSPNFDGKSILLLLDYYAYNCRETGNRNKFVLQQGEEEIEFEVGFYTPENRETFIENFLGGTIEFVVIYGKATKLGGYTRIADGSYHQYVFIEDADYLRILDKDLVEIMPFVADVNDILQENGTEFELSEKNESENLPQDEKSTIDKQRLLIIAGISLLAIAGGGVTIARRYRNAKIKQ